MSKVSVILITAISSNGVIGKDGVLPWRSPEDLAHFQKTTKGHPVVFGRKTWESIPGTLPGRFPMVVGRGVCLKQPTAYFSTFEHCLEMAKAFAERYGMKQVFIGGGAAIYEMARDVVDAAIITRVHRVVSGDVYFPQGFPGPGWGQWDAEEPEVAEGNPKLTIEYWTRDR